MSDARGDVQKKTLTSLFNPIIVSTAVGVFEEQDLDDCCTELPLLASTTDADPFKNDRTTFLRGYDASITAVDLFLTKPSVPGFTNVPLVDNKYGIFHALGFHSDELGRDYIGFEMDWRSVLLDPDALGTLGEGTYQIIAELTAIALSPPDDLDFSYCLGNFTTDRADGTIRLAMKNSFILGNRFDVRDRVTFPKGWQNQIRVPGYFGYDNSDYDIEFTKYRDGSLRDFKQQQVQHFKVRIERQPAIVHDFIKTEFWQADEKDITDYNRNNYKEHLRTPVRNPSEYKPVIHEFTKLATVDVECDSFYDNFLKKYC